jgi:cytochrome P450
MPSRANAVLEEEVKAYFGNPDARIDPYPFYRRLREYAPIYYSPTFDFWLVTGFEAVTQVLRNDFSHDPTNYKAYRDDPNMSGMRRLFYDIFFLFRDAPAHSQYRGLFKRSFTGSAAEGLRKGMREWFFGIQEVGNAQSKIEFIHSIAHPTPFKVMCEMLDLNFADYPKIRGWVSSFISLTEPDVSPEVEAKAAVNFNEFKAYLSPIVEARVSGHVKKADVLQDLVEAVAAGMLTLDQLTMLVHMLIIGGHETTGSAIGNGVLALLRNRAQWDALVRDPSLAGQVVDEVLRYESPSRQLVWKSPRQDTEVSGTLLAKGDRIIPWLGAAHRDPAKFKDPDQFDIFRADRGNMSFGLGRHFCLGAAFARVELQEFFSTFPQSYPEAAQSAEVEWDPGLMLRGLRTFPIQLAGGN